MPDFEKWMAVKLQPLMLAASLAIPVLGCGSKEHVEERDAEDAADAVEASDDVAEEEAPGPCSRDEDCDDADRCTTDVCDTASGVCTHDPIDADGDGYVASVVSGMSCGGDDCDDGRDDVHPGAVEICDDIDQDCDGSLLDAHGADDDEDTILDEECGGEDCDDDSPDVHPGMHEECNGIDDDCDGDVDEPVAAIPNVMVTDTEAEASTARIVWTGSEYGVCWSDGRDGNIELYFARLSPEGIKREPETRLTFHDGNSGSASLVWAESQYGVAWQDDRDGDWETYFARITTLGWKIGGDLRVTEAVGESLRPSLVWSGSVFGLVWDDVRGAWTGGSGASVIAFDRISPIGTEIGGEEPIAWDPDPHPIGYRDPAIAWTGSEYAVVWLGGRIMLTRLTPQGERIGSDVSIADELEIQVSAPSIAWNGSSFGITWYAGISGDAEIAFLQVDPVGSRIGWLHRLTWSDGTSYEPPIIWAGSAYALTWYDNREGGNHDIYFARVSDDGLILQADANVSCTEAESQAPSVAWSGSEFGIVWHDGGYGDYDILFNRMVVCE
jgi:hypothetical protein